MLQKVKISKKTIYLRCICIFIIVLIIPLIMVIKANNEKIDYEELNTIIIIETSLKDIGTKEYPELKDLNCQEISKQADVVMFWDENILMKNKHGRTGILNYEVGEDE